MSLAALLVGFALGAVGYRIFIAPLVLREGVKLGILSAAGDIRAWLAACEPDLKQKIEANMDAYNLQRQVDKLVARIDASNVAPREKK